MKLITSVEELESVPDESFVVNWGGSWDGSPHVWRKVQENHWDDGYDWDTTDHIVPAYLLTEEDFKE